ncbi:hypothetical protein JZ751_020182 [Albula glossodonta]|uniref:Uncharacterized protein n=1 Tax=Albula glossodonta TaxID=121402 RepID=A0A8T2NTZ4_9TELE|nr:hypothetical protein JZ751_020182 [Albula glossodonta]
MKPGPLITGDGFHPQDLRYSEYGGGDQPERAYRVHLPRCLIRDGNTVKKSDRAKEREREIDMERDKHNSYRTTECIRFTVTIYAGGSGERTFTAAACSDRREHPPPRNSHPASSPHNSGLNEIKSPHERERAVLRQMTATSPAARRELRGLSKPPSTQNTEFWDCFPFSVNMQIDRREKPLPLRVVTVIRCVGDYHGAKPLKELLELNPRTSLMTACVEIKVIPIHLPGITARSLTVAGSSDIRIIRSAERAPENSLDVPKVAIAEVRGADDDVVTSHGKASASAQSADSPD